MKRLTRERFVGKCLFGAGGLLLASQLLIGCGIVEKITDKVKGESATESDAATKEAGTKASEDAANESEKATPVAQEAAAPEPPKAEEAPSISVEGVPDLDVTVGPNLSDVEVEESQVLNKKAVKQYKKNDFAGASEFFLKALKKNPSNLVFRYNLACTASLSGDKEKAIALLRQLKETHDCPRCFIMLAKAVDDSDFDNVRSDEQFTQLVEGAPERLTAELKLAKWIEYDGKKSLLPIRTNGLPAITDDGKRIVVVNAFKNGYRMQILNASTGKVASSAVLLNNKELDQLENEEITPKDVRMRIKTRIDKAHMKLLGRDWLAFTIKSNTISPTWLRGIARQQFELGNSSVAYRYPDMTITNSKGRQTFKGKLGAFPEDDCTELVAISEAYVNGQFHVMLFRQHNVSTEGCDPQPGKYHVVNFNE